MPVSSISSGSSVSTDAANAARSNAFRTADFMKIMLSELAQQDPFKPQDTGQIVDNMQKLQQLENVQYQAFRDDMKWGEDLVGKDVTAKQMSLSDADLKDLKASGLNPDVGFNTVTGAVTTFKVVDQKVWVGIGDKDYAIANVTQVNPPKTDSTYLAEIANSLLGKRIGFYGDTPTDLFQGQVTAVSATDSGDDVTLTVGDQQVPLKHVIKIGLQ
jgi:hypothetical protein